MNGPEPADGGCWGEQWKTCAPSALVLSPGVAYVRGWTAARDATGRLAEQVRRAGLDQDFMGLAADVSVYGNGLVKLGTITAESAQWLAVLLTRGLCEQAERAAFDTGRSAA